MGIERCLVGGCLLLRGEREANIAGVGSGRREGWDIVGDVVIDFKAFDAVAAVVAQAILPKGYIGGVAWVV